MGLNTCRFAITCHASQPGSKCYSKTFTRRWWEWLIDPCPACLPYGRKNQLFLHNQRWGHTDLDDTAHRAASSDANQCEENARGVNCSTYMKKLKDAKNSSHIIPIWLTDNEGFVMRWPPPVLLLVERPMLATTIRFQESSRARYIQCTTNYRLREVTPSVPGEAVSQWKWRLSCPRCINPDIIRDGADKKHEALCGLAYKMEIIRQHVLEDGWDDDLVIQIHVLWD